MWPHAATRFRVLGIWVAYRSKGTALRCSARVWSALGIALILLCGSIAPGARKIAAILRYLSSYVVGEGHAPSLLRPTDFFAKHGLGFDSRSTVPLLLTKKQIWGRPPKIMAAIDPHADRAGVDALNRKILKCASTWASALTADLHVIHAYIPSALAAAVSSGVPAQTPEIGRRLECESTYMQGQIAAFTRACDRIVHRSPC
jgi:hypothetical protein